MISIVLPELKYPDSIKPVKGHPGYFVINDGRVWSSKRGGHWLSIYHGENHGHVVLNGKYTKSVARLVLEAFSGNTGKVAKHIDNDNSNNHIYNLRWGGYDWRQKRIVRKQLTCSKCGEVKSVKEFCKDSRCSNGYCSQCKKCRNEYYHSNKERKRNSYLKMKYGITLNEFRELESLQDNKCAICGCEEIRITKGTLQNLSVDHNHKTGYIRGLLCNECNWQVLGLLRDDKQKVLSLLRYLQKAVDEDINWKD